MRNIQKLFPIALVFICIISASTISLAREIVVDKNSDSGFELTHGSQKQLPSTASFNNNTMKGLVPFAIQYTYLSQDSTSRVLDPNNNVKVGLIGMRTIYVYTASENNTSNLTVNNENGTDSKSDNTTAQEASSEDKVLPEANFIANVTSGYIPFSVQFATLSENATEWKWDFGDGSNSIEQNPIHTYTAPGTYNVNLIVSNPNGSASKQENIIALENAVPVLPVANFIANVTSGNAPLSVQFADLSQNVTQRSWNFGDGNISTDESPVHEYSKAGYYIASLTVYNENGTSTKTLGITVQEIPIYPVANFTANVTSGYAPLSVLFTDTSQNATSNIWDFNNDGKVYLNYSNNVYIYTAPGIYNVTLTVGNANGTNSKTQEIIVYEALNESKVLPVANFSINITSGYSPLSVLFTDFSQNATSRMWDFDSNGIADSSDTNPIYTYATPGTYTANLTVSNENGSASKTATINVLDGSSPGGSSSGGSSHSSSSSGGGGAEGSPELQSNVETKELSQVFITNEIPVEFDFPMNATSVVNITFNSKKTTGKTTTIVEMLKGKSTLTSGLPSGEIYKFLNVWIGNSGLATPKYIENLTICFKVEKSWIQDKDINLSSIALHRYSDNKWNQLPTSLLKEDDKYLYFTVKAPGFSSFAITGNATTEEIETKIQPANEAKIQPEAETDNAAQANTVLKAEQQFEQKSERRNIVILLLFGTICMIIPPLIAFLFKKDET